MLVLLNYCKYLVISIKIISLESVWIGSLWGSDKEGLFLCIWSLDLCQRHTCSGHCFCGISKVSTIVDNTILWALCVI